MGACCNANKPGRSETSRTTRDPAPGTKDLTAVDSDLHKFTDLEEWEGERYIGIGIKRMKGYKCSLPIDGLNKMREEFWSTKIKSAKIWKVLKNACVMDHEHGMNTLKINKISLINGCINECQDDKGNTYKIPNYCINDPYFEKEIVAADCNKVAKLITLNIYDLYDNKTTEITISEDEVFSEVRRAFCEKAGVNADQYKFRFLFGGVELKNDQMIYQHKIQNGYTIQILKTPLN